MKRPNSTLTLRQMNSDRERVIDWLDDWLSNMEVSAMLNGLVAYSTLGDLDCYSKEKLMEEYDACMRKEFAIAYLVEECGYTCTPPKPV